MPLSAPSIALGSVLATGFDLPELTLPFGVGLLLSYLLGAVPFGFVMARVLKGVDIRTVGSGNIGATNAMRVLGRPLGIVAFLLDFGKGLVPTAMIAPQIAPESPGAAVLCGTAAVVGHVFPVYLGFKGGKAVATGIGAVAGIDWIVALSAGLTWLAVVGLFRVVSVASIALGAALPIAAFVRAGDDRYGYETVAACAALFLLILVRHRTNIQRLRAGTESRMGASKGAGA